MNHQLNFVLAFASIGIALAGPSQVLAGPVEELVQLAINPADPRMMAVRYEWAGDGLLYTRDGGETFSLICGSSVNDAASDVGALQKLGPIGIAGSGQLLLGVFGGLYRDDGRGCTWQREGALIDRWVTDIVAHPTDPDVTFVITSNGGEVENGIVRRNADGTLTELGSKKAMLISRLRVVPLAAGGLRFYQSGVLGQVSVTEDGGVMTTRPNYAIRYSDDEGETWTEHALGVLDGPMRLEAVDPSNPDRIVINVSRDRDSTTNTPLLDSVMVSTNRGETFEEWTEVTKFGGIAFASDGKVWIGDAGDTSTPDAARGILHAASLDDEPQVLTDAYPVNCLHLSGEKLFVCQRFSFGNASLDDGAFTPSLELPKLQRMNECEGIDTVAICRQQMCTGYCGTGHFASAPMCKAAYGSDEERGCAPVGVPSGGTGGGAAIDDAGMAGTGAAAAGGSGGIGGEGATAGSSTDAGTQEAQPKTDSGCSCRAVGDSRRGAPWALALAVVALSARFSKRWSRKPR